MLISVIIPMHNSKDFIEKCLNSILKQQDVNFEIVLIDDFSIDDTKYIANSYMKSYRNIRLYENLQHGVSAARNLGIEKSLGDYIIFVDSDDYISDNLFQTLLPYLNYGYDVIKYNAKYIGGNFSPDDDRFICAPEKFDSGEDALISFCNQGKIFATPWLYCAKKSLYTKNDLQFPVNKVHEDVAIMPLLVAFAKSVISIDYVGYYYVQHKKSIMNDRSYEKKLSRAYDFLSHYDYLHERLNNSNVSEECKKVFYNYLSKRINCKIEHLDGVDKENFITELNSRNVNSHILDGEYIAKKYH